MTTLSSFPMIWLSSLLYSFSFSLSLRYKRNFLILLFLFLAVSLVLPKFNTISSLT